jgi:peptidoglycan/LPS O-acetylase OafA/YrhL
MLQAGGTLERGRIDRLDGVRASAIFMVFAVHSGLWSMGWLGVPLFFVLSGMLITGILRRDRGASSFWGPFYIKRATRILPPLVIAFAIAAFFLSIPWHKIGLYYLFFAANIGEALYPNASRGLGVMWSLAVEEHFYLLWPFAIRFLNRKQLIRLLLCLLVAGPLLRAAFTPVFSSFWTIYYLTPFQLDGLAVGSLLALLLEEPSTTEWLRLWSGRLLPVSLALFAGASFLPAFHRDVNSVAFNSVGYSLIALVAASFIAYVLLRPGSVFSKVLGAPVMAFFGRISYGMYLFHLLGIEIAEQVGEAYGIHHPARLAILSVLPVTALSWLSFRFYEEPLIKWGRRKAAQMSGLKEQSVYTSGQVPK